MILNVAVGGNLGGAVNNSMLPATMEVDYVRVYGGNKPYLTGDNVVANNALGKVYSLSQVENGATINWTVPPGASIVNGQGTSSLTVDFGSTNGIVSADYSDNCNTNYILTMPIKVEGASTKCATFENFDEAGTITKNALTTGTLTEVANPLPADPINSSAIVGKYDRNGGEQYDVLFYDVNTIANANEYKDGTKKFYMDVYTSAAIGTEIYLQLETAASGPANYPTGRHSRYIATVQENGKWHRLIFSLLDTPDGGASPLGISKMVLLFKPNSNTADTYYFDNLDSYCSAVVPPTLVKCSSFENFDEVGTITKNALTTGTLTEVANPLPADPINNSAIVGKYDRNGGEQYDVLFYDVTTITNANDYKDGTKKFYMDVYTSATIGTEIYLQLETSASAPNNYPTGRHSRYIATVQENGKWQRLIFSLLDTPDAGASPSAITKMVILFKPNSNTADTYYFDNLDSYCSGITPPVLAKCSSFENFDEAATIAFNPLTSGILTEVANPLPADPINNSALVGKYDRNGGSQYDVLFYDVTTIADATDYKDGVRKFYMDVKTTATVGTEIILQLETSASTPINYPAGRHSRYSAVTTSNSIWQRLEFTFVDQPDAGSVPTDIKTMVLLFKPNSNTADTYYFDNLDSYCSEVPPPPSITKCSSFENFDEAATVIKNALTTGVLTEVANPLPADPINNSALVGKYDRDGSAAYDVLFYDVTTISNATEYKDGVKKFYMDVFTAAPIGTEIILQLETSAAAPGNYPVGRHSRFNAFTTSTSNWQRLEFTFVDQPDGGSVPTDIKMMVLLFKPGTNTADTYYFDNLDSYCIPTAQISGIVYESCAGGTIGGTPLSVGGTYISLFKSTNNTAVPDAVIPVAQGTGAYSFPLMPDGTYTLVIGTSAAGSNVASYPNVGNFSMTSCAEGQAGTAGDGTPNGKTQVIIQGNNVSYSNAKIAATGSIAFGLAPLSPLPVRLISFDGKATEKGNELTWKTSEEKNFSHFEIQRSSNAKVFEKIGQVKGNLSENYEYHDSTPLIGAGGLYRLKMIDLDGSFEFSKIIYIENKSEKSTVGNFYPNPAIGNEVNIIVNSTARSNWNITAFDLTGNIISTENRLLEKGENKLKLGNIPNQFKMAIYRFESSDGIQYRKLIK